MPNQSLIKRQMRQPATNAMINPRISLAPNAEAQWSSLRPSCVVKHPNAAHRHGRTLHDKTQTPGPSLRRRRTNQCGYLTKSYAATGLWSCEEMQVGQAILGKSIYLRCSSARNRSLKPTITAPVTHNPHSTESCPRFPPCQICRRCSSR